MTTPIVPQGWSQRLLWLGIAITGAAAAGADAVAAGSAGGDSDPPPEQAEVNLQDGTRLHASLLIAADSRRTSMTVGLSARLAPRTTGSVQVRHAVDRGTTNGYSETAIGGLITHRF